MSNYRRYHVPGGTYFFTSCLEDTSSDLLVREIDRLRHATRMTMARFPFRIDAIAVLPSVIHTIWTLPPGDSDYSTRWRMLKSQFSRGLPASEDRHSSKLAHRNKGIWQRRFWEHLIRDEADFDVHRMLTLSAPVQSNLVAHPQDWPYSSWHRDNLTARKSPFRPDLKDVATQTDKRRQVAEALVLE